MWMSWSSFSRVSALDFFEWLLWNASFRHYLVGVEPYFRDEVLRTAAHQ
jgi:hypothetical protein